MKIINTTQTKVVAENVMIAETLRKKTRGLLGYDVPFPIFFKSRWGIHTIGLKFPIDLLVCGDNFVVRFIRKAVAPGNLVFWWPWYRNVIELPAGTIDKNGTQYGDQLRLIG
jgi:uncharacterized protein